MKNTSAFLLISVAFLCASCSKEANVALRINEQRVERVDDCWLARSRIPQGRGRVGTNAMILARKRRDERVDHCRVAIS